LAPIGRWLLVVHYLLLPDLNAVRGIEHFEAGLDRDPCARLWGVWVPACSNANPVEHQKQISPATLERCGMSGRSLKREKASLLPRSAAFASRHVVTLSFSDPGLGAFPFQGGAELSGLPPVQSNNPFRRRRWRAGRNSLKRIRFLV
jgi:hypothetical protein